MKPPAMSRRSLMTGALGLATALAARPGWAQGQNPFGAPELIELIPSARLVTIAGRDHMSAVTARDFKQAALDFLTAE